MKDVVGLFGSNFTVTMEEYFTQLESIRHTVLRAGRSSPAFSPTQVAANRERLMAALAATLEESTDVSKRGAVPCRHHAALVDALRPQDTIISFNYDCVMDHALRIHGGGKWSARHGYALPRPSRVEGYEHWDAQDPPTSASGSIYLLKLHGSLNWQLPSPQEAETGRITLKQRLYQQRGTPRFTIIPPEWSKKIDDDANFFALWRNAERAVRNARTIALVGFSFTPTDSHAESLFRVALAANKLKTLVIANPSVADRHRIRGIFGRVLGENNVTVRQYEDLEDFSAHLPTVLS